MESWQLSAIFGLITYISIFVTVRNKTDQHSKDIEKLQEGSTSHRKDEEGLHTKLFERIDFLNKEIAELKVKVGVAPTMEQVRADFVTKEMFNQMQKHMDEKFDKLENGIDKILNKLDRN
jgi:flagellar motor protein MotB